MAFCCNVELLWLSSVLQPIALDQDPLVCINVSPPACSKVLHSDEYQNLPLSINVVLKMDVYQMEDGLVRTNFPHFLSLRLHSGSVYIVYCLVIIE